MWGFMKTGAEEAKHDRIQTNHMNIQQDNTKLKKKIYIYI